MFRKLALSAALMLTLGGTAHAEALNYTFDKLHTQIHFTVNHLGFSNSTGKFLTFDGGFTFDEAKPAEGSVNVTIDTNSINMDDKTWEEHLKAEDMFNVGKFPTMAFKSTKVELTSEKSAKMTGDLTLLGQTKPVTLDVVYNKCAVNPFTQQPTCGFSAVGTLKRSEWGMTKAIPLVGDDVKLMIEVEGNAPAKSEMNK